jgi:hypothetical protein
MTAAQVIEEQARLLNIWTAEDAERAARFAAILAK